MSDTSTLFNSLSETVLYSALLRRFLNSITNSIQDSITRSAPTHRITGPPRQSPAENDFREPLSNHDMPYLFPCQRRAYWKVTVYERVF
jgi:hypothetical protein